MNFKESKQVSSLCLVQDHRSSAWYQRFFKTRRFRSGRTSGSPSRFLGKKEYRIGKKWGFDQKRCDSWTTPVDLELQAAEVQPFTLRLAQALQPIADQAIIKFLETLVILFYQISRSRNNMDRLAAIAAFVESNTTGSLIGHAVAFTTQLSLLVEALVSSEFEIQADGFDTLEGGVVSFRRLLSHWDELKASSLGLKYWKVATYAMRLGVANRLGLTADEKFHKDLDKRMPLSLCEKGDFVLCCVDVFSMTLHRCLIWRRTGNWEVLLHGPQTYAQWFDRCQKLKEQSAAFGNLKAVGTDYFEFVNSLRNVIEEGASIVKYTTNNFESRFARTMLNDMRRLQVSILCKDAARQERQSPFGLLIHGGSSVFKSSFTKLVFNAFRSWYDLPGGDQYRYVRDTRVQYWTGFDSSMWCVQLDDVASLMPGSGTPDTSLDELLAVVNNVPMSPPQAALNDKDTTPMRAELVLATTNTKHLNAVSLYSCPLAILRRLPIVVTLEPKPQYCREDNAAMGDPSKLPLIEDVPNFWIIKVERVAAGGALANGRQGYQHVEIATFDEVYDFLDWLKSVTDEFRDNQNKAMLGDQAMQAFNLCHGCNRAKCECELPGEQATMVGQVPTLDFVMQGEKEDAINRAFELRMMDVRAKKGLFAATCGHVNILAEIDEEYAIVRTGTVPTFKHCAHQTIKVSGKMCDVGVHDIETGISLHQEVQVTAKQGHSQVSAVRIFVTVLIDSDIWRVGHTSWVNPLFMSSTGKTLRVQTDRLINLAHKMRTRSLEESETAGISMWTPPTFSHDIARSDSGSDAGSLESIDLNDSASEKDEEEDAVIQEKMEEADRKMSAQAKLEMEGQLLENQYTLASVISKMALPYNPSWVDRIASRLAGYFISNFAVGGWTFRCFSGLLYFRWCRAMMIEYGFVCLKKLYGTRKALQYVGAFVDRCTIDQKWRRILVGCAAVVTLWTTAVILKSWFGSDDEVTSETTVTSTTVPTPVATAPAAAPVVAQGNVVSDDFFKKDERENVWKKVDMEVTSFDIDPLMTSYASLPTQQALDTIRRNVRRVVFEGSKNFRGHAFCVGGNLWVTSNHLVTEGEIKVNIYQQSQADGINGNVTFVAQQEDFFRMPEKDLCFFEVRCLSVRKSLVSLIAKESFVMGMHRGTYVGYTKEGAVKDISAPALQHVNLKAPTMPAAMDYWRSVGAGETERGDCGRPLVIHGRHVIIAGIHQLRETNANNTYANFLTQECVQKAIEHFGRPIIQSGIPNFKVEGFEKVLGPLHHKSPLRYFKEGSAHIYGSIVGGYNSSRSKVKKTMFAETIAEERGIKPDFCAPVFDWRLYNNALSDILGMKNVLKAGVLRQATAGFIKDLKAGLSKEALNGLKVLSWRAAVNGIDGVRFLDKMNFNSSMGFPWHRSKRHFLRVDPEQDGVKQTFPDAVWKQIFAIDEKCRAGVRTCPVFTGQGKDEARATEKVAQGKVRLFTGGPTDWCVVNRRYLLTMVKTIQENQTLFEAAPGCVAQSLEWEAFREYLTAFGSDRIVAGDYGKFDKRMSADIILAAFEVMIALLEAAGWDEEEIRAVWTIACDTAYPMVNLNGDLVEFFGSNPSGHPLTVIVNSIANALYMRYAYIELNPEHECSTFKKFVHLLTYGDDNVMGVAKEVEWFNHTAIQATMKSIGVEYTMADKTSESTPFISIDDVAFLKRKWRWDADVQAFLCPLEITSIWKSLCINIPSSTLSEEAQMVAVMVGAVNEWFYHGRETFEKERAYLLTLVEKFSLQAEMQAMPFPTWDELVCRFKKSSDHVCLKRFGGGCAPPEWYQTTRG